MPIGLAFTKNGYKHFIKEFRANCTRAAGQTFVVNSDVGGQNKAFRYRKSDEYLVAIDNAGTGVFTDLQTAPIDQGHYQNMAAVDKIDMNRVNMAFMQNFNQGYDSWSASLRVVVFMTAEAARSQVIYQAAQDVLHGKTLKYSDYVVYLTTYKKNREYNGLKDNQFRPLKIEDYRHPSFILEKSQM